MRPRSAALRGPRRAWRLVAGLAGAGAVVVAGAVTVPATTTGCATHQCDASNTTYTGGHWVSPTFYVTSDWNEDWVPYPGAVNLTVTFPPGGVAPGRGPTSVRGYIGTGVGPNGGADFQGGEDWTPASGQVMEYYFLSPASFSVANGTCGQYYARFEVTFATPGFSLFGGTAPDGSTLGDTWTWDGSAWTGQGTMDPRLGPEQRTGASMVSLAGMTYVFAGLDPTGFPGGPGLPRGPTYLGDMWAFDGTSWYQIYFTPTVSGQPWPAGRVDASTVALGQNIVLFGGHGEDGTQPPPYPIIDLPDTWTWDGNPLDPWSLLPVQGPSGRSGAAAGVTNGTMVLFGGTAGGTALGDTWNFDGNVWTQVALPGSGAPQAPSARFHAAAVGLPGSGGMLLFGGDDGTKKLGDTWLWNGTTWTAMTAGGSPPARAQASIGVLDGTVVLFGGTGADGRPLSDTWTWSSSSVGWVAPSVPSGPTARYGAGASGP